MNEEQLATPANPPAPPKQKPRWFHLTPGRLLVVLLVVEAVLLLSERFHWFPFNEHKGWTVLIALAAVGVFLLLMLIWFVFALLFRRRFQFSLRSLLVLTVNVAIPFSWLAVEMKRAEEQKAFLETVTFKRYDYQRNCTTLSEPAWICNLMGEDFFADVSELMIWRLYGQGISDTELNYVEEMSQLKWLMLNDITFTDAGLCHVRGLSQLELLQLRNAQVTDAGLECIQGLNQLKELDLRQTQVTDAGIAKLQKALPNCKISH
jgi:hypothetical protein